MKCFPENAVGISSSLAGFWLSSCCAFGSGWLAACLGNADENREGKSPKQAAVQTSGRIALSHPQVLGVFGCARMSGGRGAAHIPPVLVVGWEPVSLSVGTPVLGRV